MFSLENKHFADRELYLQAQRDLIQKGLYGGLPCEDLIEKGGEGSRGGKVIGHTKSGKPIYDTGSLDQHKDFTPGEHREAALLHSKKQISSSRKEDSDRHLESSTNHSLMAKEKENKDFKEGDEVRIGGKRNGVYHSKVEDGKKGYHHIKVAGTLEAHHEKDLVKKSEGDNFDGMFDKAESPEHKAKMEKVMAEFKAGTLKTPAGEKVTDRDQAIAIALSEAKVIEKAMTAAAGEGVTQKESVEHNPKDMQNPKPSDLKKAYEMLGLGDLIEKAEGSRGGKVIGHTKSGKPIYSEYHPSHRSFTAAEHKEAADLHLKAHGEIYNKHNKNRIGFHSSSGHNAEEEDQMKNHRESMDWHESMAKYVEKKDKEGSIKDRFKKQLGAEKTK